MATTNINGFNINGNNTSPDQFGHFMRKLFTGNVAGMAVSQNGTPNMTVSVSEGVALLTKNTTSSVWAEVKSATSVNIATADTSNPRIDTVVIYEDTSVSLPTTIPYLTDGGGGRFKLGTFSGTAAASPTTLSDASIQSAIGAGKAWTRLADVTVAANTTTILNSNIADKRSYATSVLDPNMRAGYSQGSVENWHSGNIWEGMDNSGIGSITVIVPPSGIVDVEINCKLYRIGSAMTQVGFSSTGANIITNYNLIFVGSQTSVDNPETGKSRFTGLTPGSTTFTARIHCGGVQTYFMPKMWVTPVA